ncbi:right-handed parallel beta-helix repeat-containing protein [Taibaiella chishuiensis]|uniref:Putative secreted protein (Por secretion system target) n=1 Tax=Taibaiella chishuiensis TaxID=1434707 RepID=A0A2P8CWE3_9BACT|nr:right-handed parallel beta-helix repeat-containing protein [Taibaiella chishuiensis]PSK89302.1 putative secreted protein (Por secretion system target) [Taibaiella chishuiensis]
MKSVKRIVLLAILSVVCMSSYGQPLQFNPNNPAHTDTSTIMVLNIKTDFGALGNNVTNDQDAFEAASEFINARKGYCQLIIPAGTYRVGKQTPGLFYYLTGRDVLKIMNCTNVSITGNGSPVIQYADNLRYGYFDPITGSPTNPIDHWIDAYTWATPGNCIYIYNSNGGDGRIRISGLTLDGNMYGGKVVIGGSLVPINIQIEHFGIFLHGAGKVTIENVTTRRFGLDGIIIRNNPDNPAHRDVVVNNCLSEYNGRLGISVIGGRDVTLNNSSFNNSGMGIIASAPCAGIDIEAEKEYITQSLWRIYDFKANNCEFGNNKNAGVVIVAGAVVTPADTLFGNNFVFSNCDIYAAPTSSFAIDLGQYRKITFDHCNITGAVFDAGNRAYKPEDGVKFLSCYFRDIYYKKTGSSCYKTRQHYTELSSVIFSTRDNALSSYMQFDNCVFDLAYKRLWNIYSTPQAPASVTNCVIKASTTGGYIDFTQIGFDSNAVLQNNKFVFYDFQEYRHQQGNTIYASPNIPGNNQFTFYNIVTNPAPAVRDTIYGKVERIDGVDSCLFTGNRTTGTEDAVKQAPSLIVYPNPSSDHSFTIKNTSEGSLEYTFLDFNGRRISYGTLRRSEQKQFHFPELAAGVYFIRTRDEKTTRTIKVVLQ